MSPLSATVSQEFTLERLQGLWARSHSGVVWRHDVDYVPVCAALMAAEEAKHGIHSTYYVRLRGPYNPFEWETNRALRSISEHGHRIGLHFDTGLARDATIDDRALYEIGLRVDRDYHALTETIPELYPTVSWHAPPHQLRWRLLCNGFHVADGPDWEGHYIADSRGVWRENPESRFAGERLQINIHPEWYFLEEPHRGRLHARETIAP